MWLDGHVNVSDKVRAKEKRLDFLSDLSEAMRFQEAQVLICAGKSDIVVLIERTRQIARQRRPSSEKRCSLVTEERLEELSTLT